MLNDFNVQENFSSSFQSFKSYAFLTKVMAIYNKTPSRAEEKKTCEQKTLAIHTWLEQTYL